MNKIGCFIILWGGKIIWKCKKASEAQEWIGGQGLQYWCLGTLLWDIGFKVERNWVQGTRAPRATRKCCPVGNWNEPHSSHHPKSITGAHRVAMVHIPGYYVTKTQGIIVLLRPLCSLVSTSTVRKEPNERSPTLDLWLFLLFLIWKKKKTHRK